MSNQYKNIMIHLRVNENLNLRFRPVMTQSCSITDTA